jgi:5'-methylthioadenosine phosphorylase
LLKVPFAIIGGSSTFSISFPDDLDDSKIKIVSKDKTYPTPFGQSPPLTVFDIMAGEKKRVVTCKMHGWMSDRTRGDSSRQIFWVFRQMGVKKILAEGGVGCINKDMKPGGLFIPDDYIDFSLRKDVSLSNDYLLIMRDPVCPALKKKAVSVIKKGKKYLVFSKGVYAVTEGRHFESRAEVRALGKLGADAVGQSFAPEVYLAREIGACYMGIYLVVNYAEGVIPEWDYKTFKDLFFSESKKIAHILVETVKNLDKTSKKKCSCEKLRLGTLLKK